MKIGILVINERYSDALVGIVEAALKRGHEVFLFFMDEGCRLIKDSKILNLLKMQGVTARLCDFNRKKLEILDSEIPAGITCGSQYDNAIMNRESDKVIVL